MGSSFDRLLTILRFLSHKVRNPLNVISNDLNYLKVSYPAENCDRSLARCRQIADFFKPADLLETVSTENFNLTQLVSEIFPEQAGGGQPFMIDGSFENLRQALVWFTELFAVESVSRPAENFFRFKLKDPVESGSLSISDKPEDENIIPLLIEAIIESSGLQYSIRDYYFDLGRL
jgi:hypothetical protein